MHEFLIFKGKEFQIFGPPLIKEFRIFSSLKYPVRKLSLEAVRVAYGCMSEIPIKARLIFFRDINYY